MSNPSGDKIIVAGLAVLVLAMAGVIGFEAWNRNRPAPRQTAPASAPAQQKAPHGHEPAPPPESPGAAPSWERHNG